MSVLTIGLNHRTAPLDVRGRFAIPLDGLRRTVLGLREHLPAAHPEVAILSTCNRTELYVAMPAGVAPCAHAPKVDATGALVLPAVSWLARHGGLSPAALQDHTYVKTGADAATHAFRVAAGMDSMVLGEPQILGQMKQAVHEADQAGALGTTLHQLFQRSFSVAKEVRSHTEIGEHSVSMAAAVVRLALQLFGDVGGLRVLFVGAGEMIERVATHVAARAPKSITVANRSAPRSQALCQRLGADAMTLGVLAERLHEFDLVVSCTASSLPLIGLGAVQRTLKQRRHRPMLMVDLAVPRDIEPEVAQLSDVYLYTVDDLALKVQRAGEQRHAALAQAERIIATGVSGFSEWLDRRASVPLIQALQRQTEDWRQAEIGKARRALARGQDIDQVLDTLSNALTRKMLHGALCGLQHSAGEDHAQWAASVQRLFLRPAEAGPGVARPH